MVLIITQNTHVKYVSDVHKFVAEVKKKDVVYERGMIVLNKYLQYWVSERRLDLACLGPDVLYMAMKFRVS
jgi:hypothetical protein